ncbi:MAG: hypothetical protein ACO2O2_02105 [Acidilobaceae archaeon]
MKEYRVKPVTITPVDISMSLLQLGVLRRADGIRPGLGASGGTSSGLLALYRKARNHNMNDATPPRSRAPIRYTVNSLQKQLLCSYNLSHKSHRLTETIF